MLNQVPDRSGNFHAVRFYKDDDELRRIVADFIGEGLLTLNPAIVIANEPHRAGIAAELSARGLNVPRLAEEGLLMLLDAHALLDEFMVDGMPNPTRFRYTMLPIVQQAGAGRRDCTIRAYGEMVDLLWKEGMTIAATRLEMLWNDLATTHDFSLLCGYAMGNFYKTADVESICRQHTHIVSEHGEAAPVG